jgi:hypothetical protein
MTRRPLKDAKPDLLLDRDLFVGRHLDTALFAALQPLKGVGALRVPLNRGALCHDAFSFGGTCSESNVRWVWSRL